MAVTFRINQMRNGVGVSSREESSSREDSGALAPSPMTLRQIPAFPRPHRGRGLGWGVCNDIAYTFVQRHS
jgi:hypothetical protein